MNWTALTPGVGLALLAAGGVLVLAWVVGRPAGRTWRCPGCGYDMSGSVSMLCSECGRTAKSERDLRRRRRSRQLLRLGALLIVCGFGVRAIEPFRREGWAGPFPLAVLDAAAPLFDDSGARLVTPLNRAWVIWVEIEPMMQHSVRNGSLPASLAALPSPPTRWERVLLVRQSRLAIGRLIAATPTASETDDLQRIKVIAQIVDADQRAALARAAEGLVHSAHEDAQTFAMYHLLNTAAGSGRELQRIGELARTGRLAIRELAYTTVPVLAEHESDAVEILRGGLSDESGQIRGSCAVSLQNLAKWGGPALEDLDRLIAKEWDSWVKKAAAVAAEKIRRANPR